MHYHVSRNGQTYGPYTLEDLQRYVASGNVLPTDMAKTDEMTDWLPVSQILGEQPAAAPAAFSTPGYADPAYIAPAYNPAAVLAASPYPDAPNLHWGLVLLFTFLTCGLFTIIWDIVIAAWVRKVKPNATSLYWYLGTVGIAVVRWIVSIALIGSAVSQGMIKGDGSSMSYHAGAGFFGLAALSGFLGLLTIVTLEVGHFMKRSELLEHFNTAEPIGLQLSGVMTFFFEPWYFQYHLNKINAMKQAARFGAQRPY